ncbi:hypothetical protein IWX81_001449 [Salinibacterium sp. CAN_S4]|uniref:hypothetical protein n=1 Tax=Salinibacterium sp. CAN_S4 TaxID=2787727 RepID=UPI0018F0201C
MPKPPSPLPHRLAGGPFTTAQALESGVTASRLRSSDLRHPFRGVNAPRAPASIVELARAYAARMPRHELFSHTTAAGIHRLRMPDGFAEHTLHVAACEPHRAPRSRGITGHQCAVTPVTVDGLRLAPPIDTWVQCAGMLGLDDLIVMGDGLIQRHSPVATLGQLESHVGLLRGVRGLRMLRLALPELRPRTDSPRETALRLLIVRAGFPEPEVNGRIHNEYGALIAHGDLVFREQKVVLEYDGGVHREKRQYFRDIYRLDDIMEERWRVIRVDNDLLNRPITLFSKLRRALRPDP